MSIKLKNQTTFNMKNTTRKYTQYTTNDKKKKTYINGL